MLVMAILCKGQAAPGADSGPVGNTPFWRTTVVEEARLQVKGALQLLSNRSKKIRFAQVPERNSVSSSDSDLSAIYP